MAKKRTRKSQLGEPPKQRKWEAVQENLPVQEDKENHQAFERSSTSPFGRTNSVFGQNNSSNIPFSPKPFGSTTPFGSQTDSSISGGGTSTGVFGATNTPFLLEFIGALPAYKYQSYEVRKQLLESIQVQMVSKQQLEAVGDTSTPVIANTPFLLEFIGAFAAYKYQSYEFRKQLLESIRVQMVSKQQLEAVGDTSTPVIGFGQKPAFGGFGLFGRAIPTSVRKPLEAVGDADIQVFGSIGAPAFGATSTPAFGATITPAIGFGQKPAFGGSGPLGRAIPTSRKLLEAVGAVGSTIPIMTCNWFADIPAFASTGAPTFGATRIYAVGRIIPIFGATRNYAGVRSIPMSLSSRPYQTAKLESISAMPPYNYERFESCFAIAGADYCLIAVDFTRDHTKISQLFGNSVMAGCCGFQADVKALQEVLSALNLKYEGQHKMPMSCPEMHRLFCHFEESYPILQSLVLGGLDGEGKGCLFYHGGQGALAPQVGYSSQNSGSRLIVPPILGYELPDTDVLAQLSEADAVHLARTMFESTIPHTGDKLEIVVLNARGVNRQRVDLRKDCD